MMNRRIAIAIVIMLGYLSLILVVGYLVYQAGSSVSCGYGAYNCTGW